MNSYIVSYVRTPLGRFGKSLSAFSPSDLGAFAIKGLINKTNVDPSAINLVIVGNILKAGHGQDLARQALTKAGIPDSVDGYTVDMVCSSAMMSVINGSQMVALGDADLVVAGGIESMSNAAFAVNSSIRKGVKFLMKNDLKLVDTLYFDGLTDPLNGMVMGEEADRVAKNEKVSRKELEEIAVSSHKRAYDATEKGILAREIVPVKTTEGIVDRDEGIRNNLTVDSIASMPPAFGKDGLHTGATSSQITDGSAMLLIANETGLKNNNLKPFAKILGYSWAAGDSWEFTKMPAAAIDKLLSKLRLSKSDVDFVENNEAFAVSSILLERYGFSRDITNVYGGAIALGHPIGASGSRIIGTLLNVMETKKGNIGIASLCHGTGGATAIAVELI